MMQMRKFVTCAFRAAGAWALAAFVLLGCSRDAGDARPVRRLADLVGRPCAVLMGTVCQEITEAVQGGIVYHSYNDVPAMFEALMTRKVDAIAVDWIIARSWAAQHSAELTCGEHYSPFDYG